MFTSTKIPASIRQGGPGASHENAKAPLESRNPPQITTSVRRAGFPEEVVGVTVTIPMTHTENHDSPGEKQ